MKLHIVGLGPGPVELLTLKSWALLASGKPVLLSDEAHEVAEELGSRGITFELIDRPVDPNLVLSWARSAPESVYAAPGNPLEAAEVRGIIEGAGHLGIETEIVAGLSEIEMIAPKDPLTDTYAVPEAIRGGLALARLISVMARLRAPDGCPWDRQQTHTSLAIHLLEEAHESLDAIDRGDIRALEEELGDLLLQVVFHSEIAKETGQFEIADVVEHLLDKLVHRHPHIFGDLVVHDAEDVLVNWEELKHEQEERSSLDEGIPKSMPALLYAHKAQRRIAGATSRFEPDPKTAIDLIDALANIGGEQADEVVGELLYQVVALAHRAGIDPEGALRRFSNALLQSTEP